MPSRSVELVRRAYAALARGDAPALLRLAGDGLEWTEPEDLPYGGTYRGRDGLVELMARWGNTYDECVLDPAEFLDAGSSIVVIGRSRMTAHGGGTFDATFVHVWEVADDAIVRHRDFTDAAAGLARAMAVG